MYVQGFDKSVTSWSLDAIHLLDIVCGHTRALVSKELPENSPVKYSV